MHEGFTICILYTKALLYIIQVSASDPRPDFAVSVQCPWTVYFNELGQW